MQQTKKSKITLMLQTKNQVNFDQLLELIQHYNIQTFFFIQQILEVKNNKFKLTIVQRNENSDGNEMSNFIDALINSFEITGFSTDTVEMTVFPSKIQECLLTTRPIQKSKEELNKLHYQQDQLFNKITLIQNTLDEFNKIQDQNKKKIVDMISQNKFHEQLQKIVTESNQNQSRINNLIVDIKNLKKRYQEVEDQFDN